MKRIALGNDHGGLRYKRAIYNHLLEKGYDVLDCGSFSEESTDFPIYSKKVCDLVKSGTYDFGILVCGTGIGMSIAANKTDGIRAALLSDMFSAKVTREHNNTNVCCLGQRVIGEDLAIEIVDTWLAAEYLGGKYENRIKMIEEGFCDE